MYLFAENTIMMEEYQMMRNIMDTQSRMLNRI